MMFENTYLMLLLLIPFMLFALLVLTNKEAIERVFTPEVLDRIKVSDSGLSNRVRNSIIFVAILLMIIAIGHPVIKKGEREITTKGQDITIAIDISGSMRSKDRYPNRLEFAKLKINQLIKKLPEDEFMILAFSQNVYLASAMTDDKYTLKEVINGISKDYLQGASNFSALANVLKNKLKNSSKTVILVSDGGEDSDLEEFKKIVNKENIKLYAILIGSLEGAPILDSKGKAILKNDKVVISRVNKKLGEIAKKSGGDYIIAEYGREDMNKFAKKIDSNLDSKTFNKVIKIEQKKELFYYPLILSLILLIIAFSSTPKREDFTQLFKFRSQK